MKRKDVGFVHNWTMASTAAWYGLDCECADEGTAAARRLSVNAWPAPHVPLNPLRGGGATQSTPALVSPWEPSQYAYFHKAICGLVCVCVVALVQYRASHQLKAAGDGASVGFADDYVLDLEAPNPLLPRPHLGYSQADIGLENPIHHLPTVPTCSTNAPNCSRVLNWRAACPTKALATVPPATIEASSPIPNLMLVSTFQCNCDTQSQLNSFTAVATVPTTHLVDPSIYLRTLPHGLAITTAPAFEPTTLHYTLTLYHAPKKRITFLRSIPFPPHVIQAASYARFHCHKHAAAAFKRSAKLEHGPQFEATPRLQHIKVMLKQSKAPAQSTSTSYVEWSSGSPPTPLHVILPLTLRKSTLHVPGPHHMTSVPSFQYASTCPQPPDDVCSLHIEQVSPSPTTLLSPAPAEASLHTFPVCSLHRELVNHTLRSPTHYAPASSFENDNDVRFEPTPIPAGVPVTAASSGTGTAASSQRVHPMVILVPTSPHQVPTPAFTTPTSTRTSAPSTTFAPLPPQRLGDISATGSTTTIGSTMFAVGPSSSPSRKTPGRPRLRINVLGFEINFTLNL